MPNGKLYSKEEIDFLKTNYPRLSAKELAAKLNRTPTGIYRVIYRHTGRHRIGNNPPNKTPWTEEKLQFIKDNYSRMSNREIASAVGFTLTVTRNKLYELGLKRIELEYWTKEQVKLLKDSYRLVGDLEIARYFNALFEKKKGWTEKHIRKKRVYLNLHRTSKQVKEIKIRNVDLGSGYVSNLKRWDGNVTRVGRVKNQMRGGKIIPRIKTDDGFVDLHRFNYEQAFGPIPAGHCIVRKDSTIPDYSSANLECVTWQEMCHRNFENSNVWYAGNLARGDQELKKQLINHPEILELCRVRSKLRKEIKNAARKKVG